MIVIHCLAPLRNEQTAGTRRPSEIWGAFTKTKKRRRSMEERCTWSRARVKKKKWSHVFTRTHDVLDDNAANVVLLWSDFYSYSQSGMRSTPAKFRLPTVLEDSVRKRVVEAGYKSLSEYVLGLVRYDLLTRRQHAATAGIAELPRSEQDKVDDELAALFAKGETLGGSWFEARLQEAVQDAGLPEEEKPRIVKALLQRLTSRANSTKETS